jgi:hypothetical protein
MDLVAFSIGGGNGIVIDGLWLAAALTGLAAILTAWAAVLRARKQGSKECEEHLAESRSETEKLQGELHHLRMAHPEVIGED